MAIIKNSIDWDYLAKIYYKDEFIGECTNELAFLDLRCQIKLEQDPNYSFELVKLEPFKRTEKVSERYKFDKNGNYPDNMSFDLYWPSYEACLMYLLLDK